VISDVTSWKQKLDPAFDQFIKVHLVALEKMCLPQSKGYLRLGEGPFQTIELEGFPSLASMYEYNRPADALSDIGLIFDEPLTVEDIRSMKRELKKEQNIFTIILEGARELRGDSGNYYLSVFKPLLSKRTCDECLSTKNDSDVKAFVKRVRGDILSFFYNWFMLPLASKEIELRRSVEMRNFRLSTRMIKRVLFYTWDAVSLMVNGASLKELLKRAREGDDKSLFQLVKVDKTLFDHDWVRERINKASYSGDNLFFEGLGDAIRSDPLEHDRIKVRLDKLFVILKFFWNYGLYKLSDSELHELLIQSEIADVTENHHDVESFSKFLQRNRVYLPK